MLTKVHARRLREIYRSAGWPSQDLIEVELLAEGLLERMRTAEGHECLRVTEAGIRLLADTLVKNRAARSAHEALVEQVAREMARAGRIAWRGLSLRALVPADMPQDATDPTDASAMGTAGEGAPVADARRWCIAMPDVFSIRNTTVEAYAQPIVHEVKVRRADLLGELRNPAKRAAYLDLSSECWYVLGCDAKGRPIASEDEIPAECGVMLCEQGRLIVVRNAPRRAKTVSFGTWIALARATPVTGLDAETQGLL